MNESSSAVTLADEGAQPTDDAVLDGWLREAVNSINGEVETIAGVMQEDGWGLHEAAVIAALGVLRHERAPLHRAFESSRMQDAVWCLIQHFRDARREVLSARIGQGIVSVPHRPWSYGTAAHRSLDDGRQARVRMTCASPELVLFDDVLSPQECDGLIDLADGGMEVAGVMGDDADVIDPDVRSSRSTFLTPGSSALLDQVEARIGALVGWPVERMEDLSIVHYGPGQRFTPHWDYFDEAGKPNHGRALSVGGQRIGTVLLYLSDVPAGGATSLDVAGIELLPKRGSVAYFSYRLPGGGTDAASLHGGTPVIQGDKWIATLWLREGVYRRSTN